MTITVNTQSCTLPMAGVPTVRAYEGTRVFSVVEAPVASAARVHSGIAVCAVSEDLGVLSILSGRSLSPRNSSQVSFGWRASTSSRVTPVAGVSVQTGAVVEAVAGRESAEAGSARGLKRQATPVFRTLPAADGRRGRLMHDLQDQQQDQFGTTGVGTEGYAHGTAANGTSPIDPRDHRTSSPPG